MGPILEDYKKAVGRLEEILSEEKTDINRDSAIKRFEICFDLTWKVIKSYAAKEGVECYSPRECFKTAFQIKLTDYDENWLLMVDARNKSAHLYSEALADDVYEDLEIYLGLFKLLLKKLG